MTVTATILGEIHQSYDHSGLVATSKTNGNEMKRRYDQGTHALK
jgi:hypothetical protein